jgi:hypothetical protein
MNVVQSSGFGYKQSLGPLQEVSAISSVGQTKPPGVVAAWVVDDAAVVGAAVVGAAVVGGAVVGSAVVGSAVVGSGVLFSTIHSELVGQSHSFKVSFHTRAGVLGAHGLSQARPVSSH